ncbi:unnamed protein product [Soboliphyme baturini]|uniref:Metallophos_2 domain-containing protein n=1 Tax=Soboliphyme baturini TaxID=241478 RepID=A0A183IDC2_9BILA|nr:unnamed protein product [Soboliphyme baturini]
MVVLISHSHRDLLLRFACEERRRISSRGCLCDANVLSSTGFGTGYESFELVACLFDGDMYSPYHRAVMGSCGIF